MTNEQTIQLVYSSVAASKMTPEQLTSILQTSRKNNKKSNITGLLVHRQSCFLQVLEGPEHGVNQLIEIIKKDSRHKNLTVLYSEVVEQRDYGDWAMAFNGNEQDKIEGLSDFLKPIGSKDEARMNSGAVKMLLTRFKAVNRR